MRRRIRQIWIITIATDIIVITRYFFPKVTTTRKKKGRKQLNFCREIYVQLCIGEMEYQKCVPSIDLISRTVQAIFFGQLYLSFNRAFNEYMLKLRNNKNTFEYAVRLNTKAAIAQVYKNKIPSLP